MLGSPLDPLRLALGQEHLDRRGDLRRRGWEELPEPRRWVLMDDAGNVALQPAAEAADPRSAPEPAPGSAPELARVVPPALPPDPGQDLFLGVDGSGCAVLGRVVGREDRSHLQWSSLRSVGMLLGDEDRAIVAELLALANWHATHRRCPRCGAATEVAGLGWWRTCPQDGSEHYPRTDPAVIGLLLDDEDHALLGRQTRWPEGAFSTLAGFVEPGESAEAALSRELHEEVGLRPVATEYLGSQPWPFPASLMLGFHARVPGVRPPPRVDGYEIAEARWIGRDELPSLAAEREVRLPGRLSIAHHLISRWFGAELPDAWCRW